MSIVKLNNRGVKDATTFGSITSLGSLTLIKKQTASSSATISFVDGTSGVVLDNTFQEYLFTFNNMHPDTDGVAFVFGANAVGQSGFNETITSSFFRAYHGEGAEGGVVAYETGSDRAQISDYQRITEELIGSDNDQCMSGYLHLFNPSSTTFVKHFIADTNSYHASNYSVRSFLGGYINTSSAIDEIEFKMHSGDIDSGDICLYGLS